MDFNERTIQAKQQRALHRREMSGREVDEPGDDRLPLGQHLVNNFPVLDLGYKPDLSLEDWTLTLDGFVANPLTWSWAEFQAQPIVELVTDFHCVTTWSMLDCAWKGFRFRGRRARARDSARRGRRFP